MEAGIETFKGFSCDSHKWSMSDNILVYMSKEMVLDLCNDLAWVNEGCDVENICGCRFNVILFSHQHKQQQDFHQIHSPSIH